MLRCPCAPLPESSLGGRCCGAAAGRVPAGRLRLRRCAAWPVALTDRYLSSPAAKAIFIKFY
jgi:hypothetical protein